MKRIINIIVAMIFVIFLFRSTFINHSYAYDIYDENGKQDYHYITIEEVYNLADKEINDNGYKFDPYLVCAIAQKESSLRVNVQNSLGCKGLCQVNWNSKGNKEKEKEYGLSSDDWSNAESNVKMACYMLNYMYNIQEGKINYILKQYGGRSSVKDEYVTDVLNIYEQIKTNYPDLANN